MNSLDESTAPGVASVALWRLHVRQIARHLLATLTCRWDRGRFLLRQRSTLHWKRQRRRKLLHLPPARRRACLADKRAASLRPWMSPPRQERARHRLHHRLVRRRGLPLPAFAAGAAGPRPGSDSNRDEFRRMPRTRGGFHHIRRRRPEGSARPVQPWRGRCFLLTAFWTRSRHRNLRAGYHPEPRRGFLPRGWHR